MKDTFEFTQRRGLEYLTIPAFGATGLVDHAFSTRKGGVSSGAYSSLNLGFGKKDGRENVLENRRRFLQALNLLPSSLVAGKQVHGTGIAVVTEKHRGRGSYSHGDGLPGTDALITNKKGLVLSTYFADCVPLLFLDPVRRVIGTAHAGWKGSIAAIGPKTLARMEGAYATEASHCLVGIGPSIGPCCYEVGKEVLDPLKEVFPTDWYLYVVPGGKGKFHLNLWELNRQQLLAAGVRDKNIFLSSLCTFCHRDTFFSYRAQGGNTGSLSAVIALK
ncbi:MAG: peptidoglycan editing factor PgeF [Firmicutes bacterium]|nr:peptidoglycan editing factor PgeF [Bacillota bacterium]